MRGATVRGDLPSACGGYPARVSGDVDGHVTELLRFDDFIEGPHYHLPAGGDPIPFDQAALGEPLTWFVSQLRDHLGELLAEAGFARVLSDVDLDAVTDHGRGHQESDGGLRARRLRTSARRRPATIPCLILRQPPDKSLGRERIGRRHHPAIRRRRQTFSLKGRVRNVTSQVDGHAQPYVESG